MLLGSLLCLLAVTAWGFMFPVMANALQFIDPFFFTTIRYGSAAIIFLILLLLTEGTKSLRLEKKNTFVTLLWNSRFRRIWFSCFLRTATCRTVWSHPCRDDSVSYATHRFIIAVANKNKRPQNYTFLCMFVALFGVMLVISKGNIHLLFELPVTFQQIYLCYAALLAGSFIQTVVLVFNLGHHLGIRR